MQQQHQCVAVGCEATIPIQQLMCAFHWNQVPRPIQKRLWSYFRAGQDRERLCLEGFWLTLVDAIKSVSDPLARR